jgi:hypothetical protein
MTAPDDIKSRWKAFLFAYGWEREVEMMRESSMRKLILGLTLLTAVSCSAADKEYQKSRYLDVSSQAYQKIIGNSSVLRHENDMSVHIGDLIYVGQCEEKRHFSSCRPGTWIIGDMIDVRIEKDHMYLRKPDGGEVKTIIVKRVRAS